MKTKPRARMTRSTVKKKRNPQDLTLRNLHALHDRIDELRDLMMQVRGIASDAYNAACQARDKR